MKTKLLAGVALASLVAHPAFALDEGAIAAQLKAMQEQINALQGQVKTLNKELATAKKQASDAEKTASVAKMAAESPSAGGKVVAAKAPSGSDVKVSLTPGPKIETADGETMFKLGGFAQIDAGVFNDDKVGYPSGTNFRRVRLNASGTIAHDFNYKIEDDFAGNASTLTDAYVEYTGLRPVSIMAGQFKEPFSLETLTSDLFTSFVERASPYAAFSPDRNIGAQVSTHYDTPGLGAWTIAAGQFGGNAGTTTNTGDESHDTTGRFTWAPIAEKDKVLHLGIADAWRVPDGSTNFMRFSSNPETKLSNSRLTVDTGNVTNVDHVNLTGLEFAGVYGPASVQSEYMRADVERKRGNRGGVLDGYYVEASYFLTGESRNYLKESGKFDRVSPKNNFSLSKGGWGAWQVMVRFSDLDLNDLPSIQGGEMRNWSAGVKWYMNPNVAMLLDYTKIDSDSHATTPNDKPSVWVGRLQFDF